MKDNESIISDLVNILDNNNNYDDLAKAIIKYIEVWYYNKIKELSEAITKKAVY